MKNIRKRISARLGLFIIIPVMILFELILSSCSTDEIKIENNFSFEIQTMPIPKNIASGETVEIRMKIIQKGNFSETKYYIRYFQFEGTGTLQYYDQLPYLQNDSYELNAKEFRLYYTSTSELSESFKVWIFDSFGNEKQIDFQFENKN